VNPSEKPYALTGEQREQDRAPDFKFQGRAGIQYR